MTSLPILAHRIMSGKTRLRLKRNGRIRTYYMVEPTADIQMMAEEFHASQLKKIKKTGVYTNAECIEASCGLLRWGKGPEKELEKEIGGLDTLKRDLYLKKDSAVAVKFIKEQLAKSRETISTLLSAKFEFCNNSVESLASVRKTRFIVGKCLHDSISKRVWPTSLFMREEDPLLDEACTAYIDSRPSLENIRAIARGEPWRSTWAAREACSSIFGRNACDLSEDQRALVAWTRFYDNAREQPEPPEEEVIADDDMFDGWLISRKAENMDKMKKYVTNEKNRNADHVFVTADAVRTGDTGDINAGIDAKFDEETAQRVYDLGGEKGRQMAAAIMATVDQKGEYREKARR